MWNYLSVNPDRPNENENEKYAAKKRRRKQETSRLAKKAKRFRPASALKHSSADYRELFVNPGRLAFFVNNFSSVGIRRINGKLLSPEVLLLSKDPGTIPTRLSRTARRRLKLTPSFPPLSS